MTSPGVADQLDVADDFAATEARLLDEAANAPEKPDRMAELRTRLEGIAEEADYFDFPSLARQIRDAARG